MTLIEIYSHFFYQGLAVVLSIPVMWLHFKGRTAISSHWGLAVIGCSILLPFLGGMLLQGECSLHNALRGAPYCLLYMVLLFIADFGLGMLQKARPIRILAATLLLIIGAILIYRAFILGLFVGLP